MKPDYNISFYLDTRRKLKSGKYPVKLKIYIVSTRKNKYYPTKFRFTKIEFSSIWHTIKPRKEYRETRRRSYLKQIKRLNQ